MILKVYRAFTFAFLLTMPFLSSAQSVKNILLNKVDSIPMPPEGELISTFLAENENAEVIAMAAPSQDLPVKTTAIMASTYGKGKILAFGSTFYLKPEMLHDKNVAQLFINALNWAGSGKSPLNVALGENTGNPALTDLLNTQHALVYTAPKVSLKSHTDVLILTENVIDTNQIKAIETFVKEGGTLIFGSPYPDSLKKYSRISLKLNDFFLKAGICNFFETQKRAPGYTLLLTDSVPDYLPFKTALPRLLKPDKTDFDHTIEYYLIEVQLQIALYANDINSPNITGLKKVFEVPDTMAVPTVKNPAHFATPQQKMAARLYYQLNERKQDFEHHPTAKAEGYKSFPGDVPKNAARVTQTVNIPVMVGTQGLPDMPSVYFRPHSTGLYVPAGEKVTIILRRKDSKEHLKAQIGVHDDDVTQLDEVRRLPIDLTKTFDLDKERTVVYSPYGGLLLISIADTSKLKNIQIKVQGAVRAPYFKLGQTSEADWVKIIRKNPAPWAELATDKIVFTVPSSYVRNLDNPVKLLRFWDEVMDADADLAIISRKRVHQERLIIDVSVAYGSLFTVPYKIVAPDEESSHQMLDESYMRSKGLWGQFHELGHRHQFFDLNFPGITEVTVNLFTMYVFEKVLHKSMYQHEGMETKELVIEKIKSYLDDNPTHEKWCQDPWVALSMYIQIIDAFGWDAIKAANTVYRNLPKDQYPQTDQAKRDLWFTTICKVTKSNMTRFFEVWKFPVSDEARKQTAAYKEWFPQELAAYK